MDARDPGWMDGCVDGWTDLWMDEWMDRQMNGAQGGTLPYFGYLQMWGGMWKSFHL